MKKTIRRGVFETNSSSMHSFTIDEKSEILTLEPNEDGVIFIQFPEFGWEIEKYTSVQDKLNYVATYVFNYGVDKEVTENDFELNDDSFGSYKYIGDNEKILYFEDTIKRHTGASNIYYDLGSNYYKYYYKFGYIDHQSVDVGADAFHNMLNFVFRKNSILITDNDNH